MSRQAAIQFFKRLGAGAIIGIGSIVPGMSGGVIAVTMGLYERVLESITHFFQNPRNNAFFLLPLGLGAGFGILAFSNIVAWSMTNYREQVIFLFIGFVLGGIPSLLRKANRNGFKLNMLLPLILGLMMILLPARLELLARATQGDGSLSVVMGLISGVILAVGTIVPGISSSFLLMYLGTYQSIILAISTLDIPALIPVAIGALVSALAIIKVVSYLFERFPAYSYYAALGLLIGSIILVLPPFRFEPVLAINILLSAVGYATAYSLGKIEN